jgi:hypothetical protein
MRIKYGLYVVLVGFLLVGIVFVAALTKFTAVSDVTAAVGVVTSVVGTLAGAFFGVHVGSVGKETGDAARRYAAGYAALLTQTQVEEVNKRLASAL